MLRVSKTVLATDRTELTVFVDGDNFEEVGSPTARQVAADAAAKEGFANVAVNPGGGPYAVDPATDLPLTEPRPGLVITTYRTEVRLGLRM